MPFNRFILMYIPQVLVNAIIGATIIFFCWNWAILPVAGVSIPHFSFLQCIGIYFIIGVIRGDFKCYIK